MAEAIKFLPDQYVPLQAKDYGRGIRETDSSEQQAADRLTAQEFVDYRNRLEVIDLQTKPMPEVISPNDPQLAERVKSDFDSYGMVIVASEMNQEVKGVKEELNREQIEQEVALLEELRANIEANTVISDKQRVQELKDIDKDIADVKSGKDLRPTFDSIEVIQELPGQPHRKLKIYADNNRWNINVIVPRGLNKSGVGVISAVHTEKQKQLPLEGVIWSPFDYARREADPRLQPALVVSVFKDNKNKFT